MSHADHDETVFRPADVIWRRGAFAGEFGDVFVKDTELEGA